MKTINCFLPYVDEAQVKATVEGLKSSELVTKIFLLATDAEAKPMEGCELLKIDGLNTSATMKKIADSLVKAVEDSRNYMKDSASREALKALKDFIEKEEKK